MGNPREDVEFRTADGTTLRGWFYPQEQKSGCIIMTHGVSVVIPQFARKLTVQIQLGGIRHYNLPNFAARFQDAGYAVLLYDNRGWGG